MKVKQYKGRKEGRKEGWKKERLNFIFLGVTLNKRKTKR
jgi:hypothetical protein